MFSLVPQPLLTNRLPGSSRCVALIPRPPQGARIRRAPPTPMNGQEAIFFLGTHNNDIIQCEGLAVGLAIFESCATEWRHGEQATGGVTEFRK